MMRVKASRRVKRAFLGGALLTIITVMLMLGSTMAWFQDSKVVINTYTFGNLDVDIMHKQGTSGEIVSATALKFKKCYGTGGLYHEGEFLFEPGATFQLEDVYIKNSGDVPLKYRLEVDKSNITIEGQENLLDAMDIYFRMNNNLYSGEEPQYLDVGETSDPIQIYLHMQEDAGNEYQDLTVSGVVVKVVAVQNEGIPDDQLEAAFQEAAAK